MNRTQFIAIGLVIVIGIAAVSYFAFTGMGPSGPTAGGTLTIAHDAPWVSFDPREGGPQALPFAPVCFDQAFEPFLKDGELQPRLLESWERLDDNVTYIFHIREGVKFHDGEEMTSEDWKFTFDEFRKQAPGGPAPPNPQYEWAAHISDTEVVDKYTVKIVTDGPYGAIPDIFRLPTGNLFILPKKACETLGDDFKWNPIGTGPYKFVEYVEGEYVKYERFDDYWLERPNLDYVIIQTIPNPDTMVIALENGEVDVIINPGPAQIPNLEANPNIQVWDDLVFSMIEYTAFNLRMWPTNDIRFRTAIHMAIDYTEALSAVNPYGWIEKKHGFLQNCFASGVAPWAYNSEIVDEFPEYDLDEAKRLIAELEAEAPIPPLKVWGAHMMSVWTEYLYGLLETELGLEVEFEIFVGPPTMTAMMGGQWNMMTMGWDGGYPQAFMAKMYGSQRGIMPPPGTAPPPPPPGAPPPGAPPPPPPPPPSGGENFAGYSNADVDRYLELAESQIDIEVMAHYYYLAERQAVRDLPYIWNFDSGRVVACRSDLVGDVEPWTTGHTIYLVSRDYNVYKK